MKTGIPGHLARWGGGTHRRWTEGIKSLPAHVGCVSSDRSSCSFDLCCHWLDPRPGLAVQRSIETTLLADCLRGSDSAPENQRIAPWNWRSSSPVPPFPPRMSFSWFVRALMFISLGMSSPALSHRFHTFLLANLTALLPAAESEPGVRDPRRQCYCCC